MEKMRKEYWLKKLEENSLQYLSKFINSTNTGLYSNLQQSSEQLHAAMAAWHSRGTYERVASVFKELNRFIENRTQLHSGLIRKLWLQIKSFLFESDEDENPSGILNELENIENETRQYHQRIRVLEKKHKNELDRYRDWIAALEYFRNEPIAFHETEEIQSIILRNAELISAQEQLQHAVTLHRQALGKMANDIDHLSLTAKNLMQNRESVTNMLEQRFKGE